MVLEGHAPSQQCTFALLPVLICVSSGHISAEVEADRTNFDGFLLHVLALFVPCQ